jgi:hypothetical protein
MHGRTPLERPMNIVAFYGHAGIFNLSIPTTVMLELG